MQSATPRRCRVPDNDGSIPAMKREAWEVTPEVYREFKERRDRLRDEYEDAACEAEALRCLECGFKRGGHESVARPRPYGVITPRRHAPDCETGRERPGQILISRALVAEAKSHQGKA